MTPGGKVTLKNLVVSVIKEGKWFSIQITEMVDYWSKSEAEIMQTAHSFTFK